MNRSRIVCSGVRTYFGWLRAGVAASALGLAVAAPATAHAQAGGQVDPSQVEVWDVIQTTDGNVLKGVIVEQTRTATGTIYKIVLPAGGGTLTIPENKVARITKERNPARAGAAAGYPAQPAAAYPPGAPAPAAAPAAAPAPAPGTAAYPPAAAPAYPPAAAPQYGQQPPPAAPPGYAAAPGAAPVGYGAPPQADQGGRRPINIAPPVATEGMRLGIQFGPYFPMSDLSDDNKGAGEIGIGGRVHFGYEFMFDRFGIMPFIALEVANFGTKDRPLADGTNSNDSVFYLGVQPGLQAAVHLGHVVPTFGVTFGFDHYAASGKATDALAAAGYKTDANGFGLGFLIGLNIVFTPDVSAGITGEIHPGFTSLDPGNGAPTYDLGHAALLFGAAYHF